MALEPTSVSAAVVASLVAGRTPGAVLAEAEAQRITAVIGIGLPRMEVAATVEAAARISLPGDRVVVKVSGPAHKTDRAGVQIVANNPEAITAAARQIAAAVIGEFLLAEYVEHPPGAEILAGVRWTEAFGPVVTIGPGGIGVGRGPDPAVIAPATSDRIEATLRSAPGIAPLIAGWRGSVPATTLADLAAVARALLALGVAEMPERLVEFEMNPLVFTAAGPVALDALAVVGGAREPESHPRPSGGIARQLHPKSIAVMGVSERLNPGRVILRNLLAAGYPADQITVIKPGVDEIDGCRCVPSPGALRKPVDLLILALDAAATPDAVEQVVAAGAARAVILISGGLGEVAGTESAAARIRIAVDRARAAGRPAPILTGPNSMGIRSVPGGYDATFIPPERITPVSRVGNPPPGFAGTPPFGGRNLSVAVIAQSGAFTLSRLDRLPWLRPRYVVTVGNQLDVTIGDYLEHFAADPGVAIVACYLEGFAPGDGDRVLRAVQRLRGRDGMVLWHRGGRTAAGATAAATHTAAIATDDLIARALGEASGVLAAESLDEFDDLLRLAVLLHPKTIAGTRLGVVSNAGFECVAAADAMGDLVPAEFSAPTRDRLRFVLGESGLSGVTAVHNPLDLTPMASEAAYADAAVAILDDPGVDVAVIGCVPFTPSLQTMPDQIAAAGSLPDRLAALAAHPTPWVAVVDAGRLYDPMADRIEVAGVPVLRSMDRAVRLLRRYMTARSGDA
ncbi:MAG: hypothetical protein A2135_08840 [Actinobacteria bacterium RBG_16_67_15]|nr:MAG: hypothetical protein A2135_08840 [Actinobacteria bacterium RBG_16_67_15]